jgi:hypothetical protein
MQPRKREVNIHRLYQRKYWSAGNNISVILGFMQVKEDIKLSPTEKMGAGAGILENCKQAKKLESLPPEYQEMIDRVWSGPDGDN